MLQTSQVPGVTKELALATIVIWLVMEVRQAGNQRAEATVNDQGSRMVLRISYIAGAVVAIVLFHLARGEILRPAATWAWAGLVVMWCGIGLRFWSFQTLGRYFTFTVQTSGDQPVITAGPYSVIRHPSYAGVILIVTGIGLLNRNYLSLAALIVGVTCGIVFRILVEEQALRRDLGDRYSHYAATHKRLVPYVW